MLSVILDAPPLFLFVAGFSLLIWLFESYLDLRQHFKFYEKKPATLEGIVDDKKFEEARAYGLDKSFYGFVESVRDQGVTQAELWYFILPKLWNFVGEKMLEHGYDSSYEITQSLVFAAVYYLIQKVIGIPFDLYSDFVIEARHGFNKKTLFVFIMDEIKMLFLLGVLGAPLMAALIYIIKWGGPYFYIYVWAFACVTIFVLIAVYPNVIAPMFNKFSPLEEGELKTAIEELAAKNNYPLKKLFVVDGSARSAHSNAYMYGFGNNKRIVLYDTLLKQATTPQIVAILGHELGHWKMGHTIKNLIFTQVHLFVFFFLFGNVISNATMFESFGFDPVAKPTIIGLILFSLLISPIEHVVGFGMVNLTRRFEFQADAFAVKQGYATDLQQGLICIHIENLSNMNPDPWYSAYHHSHPPLLERLRAMGYKHK